MSRHKKTPPELHVRRQRDQNRSKTRKGGDGKGSSGVYKVRHFFNSFIVSYWLLLTYPEVRTAPEHEKTQKTCDTHVFFVFWGCSLSLPPSLPPSLPSPAVPPLPIQQPNPSDTKNAPVGGSPSPFLVAEHKKRASDVFRVRLVQHEKRACCGMFFILGGGLPNPSLQPDTKTRSYVGTFSCLARFPPHRAFPAAHCPATRKTRPTVGLPPHPSPADQHRKRAHMGTFQYFTVPPYSMWNEYILWIFHMDSMWNMFGLIMEWKYSIN